MMQDEWSAGGAAQTVEESVIATSLGSIRGPQRGSILALFRSLALVPEDTHAPRAPRARAAHFPLPHILVVALCYRPSTSHQIPRGIWCLYAVFLKRQCDRTLQWRCSG